MPNTIEKSLNQSQKEAAQKVLDALGLDNLKVMADEKQLTFIQDRRVVHVPMVLIEKEMWSDIRFLFNAILKNQPAVWNHGAPNTWGPQGPTYSTKED